MEFTLGEESEKPSKQQLSAEELSKNLDRLIQDKANNQRIHDWLEVNFDFHKAEFICRAVSVSGMSHLYLNSLIINSKNMDL